MAANLAALRTLQTVEAEDRAASPEEQAVLARWSGWGAVPRVFDPDAEEYAEQRAELAGLLSESDYAAARRNTLNAHYTDAAYVQPVWDALSRLGLESGHQVLEPGCGSGNFLGFAPEGMQLTGVELDPTTARIAAVVYPQHTVLSGSFADVHDADESFDAAIGNVPFSRVRLHDPGYNDAHYPMHTHFVAKSLRMTRPGGLVGVWVSRWLLDAQDSSARAEIAELADLVTAVRTPAGAHAEAAGTDVVTDFVLLRRREPDAEPDTTHPWRRVSTLAEAGLAPEDADGVVDREMGQVGVNEFFVHRPQNVLGSLNARRGRFGPELTVTAHRGVEIGAGLERVLRTDVDEALARGQGMATPPGSAPRLLKLGRDTHNRFEGTLTAHEDGTFSRWQAGQWVPHEPPKTQATELRALIGLRERVQALLAAENATAEDTAEIAELRQALNTDYDRYARRYGPLNRFSWRSQSKTGWSAFRAWCTEREHEPLGASRAVLLEYLGWLEQAGCDQALIRRHLTAITNRHATSTHVDSLDQEVLDEAEAFAASCRETPREDLDLEELGLTSYTRVTPKQGGFRADPFSSLVRALEVFDPVTQTAEKADVFAHRVVTPYTPPTRADSAADAVSVSLTTFGELRLEFVAELLDLDGPQAAREVLTGGDTPLAFVEPDTGRVVVRNEYLSGNVRAKLGLAEQAAASDPALEGNVAALREVIPRDLGPDEIEVQLGSWVEAIYVQQFLRELLDDDTRVDHVGRFWSVNGGTPSSTAARDTWGTPDRSAQALTEAVLAGRTIRITYTDSDGNTHTDAEATEAAKAKARELEDRFRDWAWEDPGRAEELVRIYNDRFNAHAPRSYDDIELTTPGLASHIGGRPLSLRPHQKAAIAAMMFNPSFGLWHEVGAGKTLEMIVGAMERKRLGLVSKQVVNVPNHMLAQFEREWLQAYPQAKLLVASNEDLAGDKRRDFVARAMTGNYDAVILTEGAFKALPVSPEAEQRFIAAERDEIESALQAAEANGAHERTVKELEERLEQATQAAKGKLAGIRRDVGISWEDLGFDSVIVDESQRYKNSRRFSGLPDMGHPGSDRATDLDMKLAILREQYGASRYTSATATPFTNSLAEIYTELKRLGADLDDLDSWARTWGELMSTQEMVPGGGFKEMTRLRKLINVPELALWLRMHADIRTAEHLQLPVPEITGGGPQAIGVPATESLIDVNANLADRYAKLKPRPERGDDNHLSLIGLGTAAALDVRLAGRETAEPQKVDALADRIHQRYLDNKDTVYLRPDGSEHPTRGGLQLVFCSLSTPDPAKWNFYDELRTQLTARGMPEQLVRFVHEAKTDQKRAELFAAARSGEIAVLIGSSEKMGTGTNVQTRALGCYQVSPPWRADTVHQEAGRVVRQGNQNAEVFVERWTTERSLEAKKWQVVLQKWEAFRPLMTGEIDRRIIEMPDEDTDHYSELMSLASGDARVRRKAELDAEVNRLTRLHKAWSRQQSGYRVTVSRADEKLPGLREQAADLSEAIGRRHDTSGEQFTMQLDGHTHTERARAAEHLAGFVQAQIADAPEQDTRTVPVGSLGGLGLRVAIRRWHQRTLAFRLDGVPGDLALHHAEVPSSHVGLITKLENWLGKLDTEHAKLTEQIQRLHAAADQARPLIGQPFAHQAELDDTTARRDRLVAELSGKHPSTTAEVYRNLDHDLEAFAAEHDIAADDDAPSTLAGQVRAVLQRPDLAEAPITARAEVFAPELGTWLREQFQADHQHGEPTALAQAVLDRPGVLPALEAIVRTHAHALRTLPAEAASIPDSAAADTAGEAAYIAAPGGAGASPHGAQNAADPAEEVASAAADGAPDTPSAQHQSDSGEPRVGEVVGALQQPSPTSSDPATADQRQEPPLPHDLDSMATWVLAAAAEPTEQLRQAVRIWVDPSQEQAERAAAHRTIGLSESAAQLWQRTLAAWPGVPRRRGGRFDAAAAAEGIRRWRDGDRSFAPTLLGATGSVTGTDRRNRHGGPVTYPGTVSEITAVILGKGSGRAPGYLLTVSRDGATASAVQLEVGVEHCEFEQDAPDLPAAAEVEQPAAAEHRDNGPESATSGQDVVRVAERSVLDLGWVRTPPRLREHAARVQQVCEIAAAHPDDTVTDQQGLPVSPEAPLQAWAADTSGYRPTTGRPVWCRGLRLEISTDGGRASARVAAPGTDEALLLRVEHSWITRQRGVADLVQGLGQWVDELADEAVWAAAEADRLEQHPRDEDGVRTWSARPAAATAPEHPGAEAEADRATPAVGALSARLQQPLRQLLQRYAVAATEDDLQGLLAALDELGRSREVVQSALVNTADNHGSRVREPVLDLLTAAADGGQDAPDGLAGEFALGLFHRDRDGVLDEVASLVTFHSHALVQGGDAQQVRPAEPDGAGEAHADAADDARDAARIARWAQQLTETAELSAGLDGRSDEAVWLQVEAARQRLLDEEVLAALGNQDPEADAVRAARAETVEARRVGDAVHAAVDAELGRDTRGQRDRLAARVAAAGPQAPQAVLELRAPAWQDRARAAIDERQREEALALLGESLAAAPSAGPAEAEARRTVRHLLAAGRNSFAGRNITDHELDDDVQRVRHRNRESAVPQDQRQQQVDLLAGYAAELRNRSGGEDGWAALLRDVEIGEIAEEIDTIAGRIAAEEGLRSPEGLRPRSQQDRVLAEDLDLLHHELTGSTTERPPVGNPLYAPLVAPRVYEARIRFNALGNRAGTVQAARVAAVLWQVQHAQLDTASALELTRRIRQQGNHPEKGAVLTAPDGRSVRLGHAQPDTSGQVVLLGTDPDSGTSTRLSMSPAAQVIDGQIQPAPASAPPTQAQSQDAAPEQDNADQQHDAASESQPGAGPWIEHGRSGTVVRGTDKHDQVLYQALKDKQTGFRWSRNQQLWFLPRRWNEDTRRQRVQRLQRALSYEGRTLPVLDPDAPGEQPGPEPDAGEHAAQEEAPQPSSGRAEAGEGESREPEQPDAGMSTGAVRQAARELHRHGYQWVRDAGATAAVEHETRTVFTDSDDAGEQTVVHELTEQVRQHRVGLISQVEQAVEAARQDGRDDSALAEAWSQALGLDMLAAQAPGRDAALLCPTRPGYPMIEARSSSGPYTRGTWLLFARAARDGRDVTQTDEWQSHRLIWGEISPDPTNPRPGVEVTFHRDADGGVVAELGLDTTRAGNQPRHVVDTVAIDLDWLALDGDQGGQRIEEALDAALSSAPQRADRIRSDALAAAEPHQQQEPTAQARRDEAADREGAQRSEEPSAADPGEPGGDPEQEQQAGQDTTHDRAAAALAANRVGRRTAGVTMDVQAAWQQQAHQAALVLGTESGQQHPWRREPALPAVSLRRLRQLAEDHQLQVSVVHAVGQAWVRLHEPDLDRFPVVSAAVGEPRVVLGGQLQVGPDRLEEMLGRYRQLVTPERLAAETGVQDWPRRLVQLTGPALSVNAIGGQVRDQIAEAAGQHDPGRAEQALAHAEVVAGQLVLPPCRVAQIMQVVADHAPRYLQAPLTSNDPARYVIEGHLNKGASWAEQVEPISTREYDFVDAVVRALRELLHERRPAELGVENRRGAPDREQAEDRAQDTAAVAWAAFFDDGDRERARDLLDAAEITAPHLRPGIDDIRARIAESGTAAETSQDAAEATEPAQSGPETEQAGDAAASDIASEVSADTAAATASQDSEASAQAQDTTHDPEHGASVEAGGAAQHDQEPEQEGLFAIEPQPAASAQSSRSVPPAGYFADAIRRALPQTAPPSGITQTAPPPHTAAAVLTRIGASGIARIAPAVQTARDLLVTDTAQSPAQQGARMLTDHAPLSDREFEYRLRLLEAIAIVLDAEEVGDERTVRGHSRAGRAPGETLSASVREMVAAARGRAVPEHTRPTAAVGEQRGPEQTGQADPGDVADTSGEGEHATAGTAPPDTAGEQGSADPVGVDEVASTTHTAAARDRRWRPDRAWTLTRDTAFHLPPPDDYLLEQGWNLVERRAGPRSGPDRNITWSVWEHGQQRLEWPMSGMRSDAGRMVAAVEQLAAVEGRTGAELGADLTTFANSPLRDSDVVEALAGLNILAVADLLRDGSEWPAAPRHGMWPTPRGGYRLNVDDYGTGVRVESRDHNRRGFLRWADVRDHFARGLTPLAREVLGETADLMASVDDPREPQWRPVLTWSHEVVSTTSHRAGQHRTAGTDSAAELDQARWRQQRDWIRRLVADESGQSEAAYVVPGHECALRLCDEPLGAWFPTARRSWSGRRRAGVTSGGVALAVSLHEHTDDSFSYGVHWREDHELRPYVSLRRFADAAAALAAAAEHLDQWDALPNPLAAGISLDERADARLDAAEADDTVIMPAQYSADDAEQWAAFYRAVAIEQESGTPWRLGAFPSWTIPAAEVPRLLEHRVAEAAHHDDPRFPVTLAAPGAKLLFAAADDPQIAVTVTVRARAHEQHLTIPTALAADGNAIQQHIEQLVGDPGRRYALARQHVEQQATSRALQDGPRLLELPDARETLRSRGWRLASADNAGEYGPTEGWERDGFWLALAFSDDDPDDPTAPESLLTDIAVGYNEDALPQEWHPTVLTDADEWERVLAEAGRVGIVLPATGRSEQFWLQVSLTRAQAEREVRDGVWGGHARVAFSDGTDWHGDDDGQRLAIVGPVPPRLDLPDRAAVLDHVLDGTTTRQVRSLVEVALGGRGRALTLDGQRQQVTAANALPLLSEHAAPAVYERAVCAAAGAGSSPDDWAHERAVAALQRYVEGDPTLPVHALGAYLDVPSSERDDSPTATLRGGVVAVEPGPGAVVLRLEWDEPRRAGIPYGRHTVAPDAELAWLDPAERPFPSAREEYRWRLFQEINMRRHNRGEPMVTGDEFAAAPEPLEPLAVDDTAPIGTADPVTVTDLVEALAASGFLDDLAAHVGNPEAYQRRGGSFGGLVRHDEGLSLEISDTSGTRRGQWSWPQILRWLAPYVTPGQRQILARVEPLYLAGRSSGYRGNPTDIMEKTVGQVAQALRSAETGPNDSDLSEQVPSVQPDWFDPALATPAESRLLARMARMAAGFCADLDRREREGAFIPEWFTDLWARLDAAAPYPGTGLREMAAEAGYTGTEAEAESGSDRSAPTTTTAAADDTTTAAAADSADATSQDEHEREHGDEPQQPPHDPAQLVPARQDTPATAAPPAPVPATAAAASPAAPAAAVPDEQAHPDRNTAITVTHHQESGTVSFSYEVRRTGGHAAWDTPGYASVRRFASAGEAFEAGAEHLQIAEQADRPETSSATRAAQVDAAIAETTPNPATAPGQDAPAVAAFYREVAITAAADRPWAAPGTPTHALPPGEAAALIPDLVDSAARSRGAWRWRPTLHAPSAQLEFAHADEPDLACWVTATAGDHTQHLAIPDSIAHDGPAIAGLIDQWLSEPVQRSAAAQQATHHHQEAQMADTHDTHNTTAPAEATGDVGDQEQDAVGGRTLTPQDLDPVTTPVSTTPAQAADQHGPGTGENDRRARLAEVTAAAARFYTDQLTAHPAVVEYLRDRLGESGLTIVRERFTIGYAPNTWRGVTDHLHQIGYTDQDLLEAGVAKQARNGRLIDRMRDRVLVAIRDEHGQVAGFAGRPPHDSYDRDQVPKYLNTPETQLYTKSEALFGLYEQRDALAAGATPVLVEGTIDVLALAGADPQQRMVPVASSGTSVTEAHLTELYTWGAGRLVLGLDGDHAGQDAAARTAAAAVRTFESVRVVSLPDGQDPNEWTARHREDPDTALQPYLDESAQRSAASFLAEHAAETYFAQQPLQRDEVEGQLAAADAAAAALRDVPEQDAIDASRQLLGQWRFVDPSSMVERLTRHRTPSAQPDSAPQPKPTDTPAAEPEDTESPQPPEQAPDDEPPADEDVDDDPEQVPRQQRAEATPAAPAAETAAAPLVIDLDAATVTGPDTPASAADDRAEPARVVVGHTPEHGPILWGTQRGDHVRDVLTRARMAGAEVGTWRWQSDLPTPDGGRGAWRLQAPPEGRQVSPALLHAAAAALSAEGVPARVDHAVPAAAAPAATSAAAAAAPAPEVRPPSPAERAAWRGMEPVPLHEAPHLQVEVATIARRWALRATVATGEHTLTLHASCRSYDRVQAIADQLASAEPAAVPEVIRRAVTTGQATATLGDDPEPLAAMSPPQWQQLLATPPATAPAAAGSQRTARETVATAASPPATGSPPVATAPRTPAAHRPARPAATTSAQPNARPSRTR